MIDSVLIELCVINMDLLRKTQWLSTQQQSIGEHLCHTKRNKMLIEE